MTEEVAATIEVKSSALGLFKETSGLYYNTFRIVIYDRNDSTIVEPVL